MVCMVRTHSHLYGGVCWWTLPNTNISTVGDGRFPFSSPAIYQGIYQEKEKKKRPPQQQSGFLHQEETCNSHKELSLSKC